MDPQPERANTSISLTAYLRLLRRNPNFRRLWLAQIVSEIGDWFYTLAIYSLLLQLTGRASSVALALVLQVLPQTLIGPAAGVINDRVRRKRVMITADLVRMVIVLAMILVRSRSTVWMVYPLLLLETLMAAFFEPARTAVIPGIAAREDVLLANTLSSATWSVNLLIGASVGGVVAALLGRDAVFVLNALSFMVSAILISRMRFEEPHAKAAAPLRARDAIDFSPVLEGIRYVRKDRRLLTAVFGKAGELMIGPSWVLFTVMGVHYFHVHIRGIDPQRGAMLGMSLLLGARGIGAVFGPLFSARWAGQSDRRLQLGVLFGYLDHWDGILRTGHFTQRVGGLPFHRSCTLRRIDSVGLFHYAASTEYGRPIPRTRLFRRPGFCHADGGDWRVHLRSFSRSWSVGQDGGLRNGPADVDTCNFVGFGDPAGKNESRFATRKHGGLAKLERVEGVSSGMLSLRSTLAGAYTEPGPRMRSRRCPD